MTGTLSPAELRDRVRGCLLGGAVGDALGAPVEFLSLAEIRATFGSEGVADYAEAYGQRGATTDDTQMTLWTVEGLIRADNRFRTRGICHMPSVVHRAYLRWLATQEGVGPLQRNNPDMGDLVTGWVWGQPVLHARRAPGNTCLSALRLGKMGEIEHPINDSKGCGGIMRVAPIGLVTKDPFGFGCEIAALTHGHPSGYLAAGAFALIVAESFRGRPLTEAINAALNELRRIPGHDETSHTIEKARHLAALGHIEPESVERLGAGWVAEEALAIALYCALVARDFRSGVLLAVNHGGDSDSTGSLTGQLLGVQGGEAVIPTRWLVALEGRDVIEQVAEDLSRHFVDRPQAPPMPKDWPMGESWPQPDDLDRYPPN